MLQNDLFAIPCKLMISYVYIQFYLELQNVANCDFRKLKYCVNIDVLF